MHIIVSYRKSLVKTGKPIVVKVWGKEIYTDNLILENITGNVIFHERVVDYHGTTTPLVIPIETETDSDVVEYDKEIIDIMAEHPGVFDQDQLKKEEKLEKKRIAERIRYRKKNKIYVPAEIPLN